MLYKKLKKYWKKADDYLNGNQPSHALPLYRKVVTLDDTVHQAHYGIAACCVRLAHPKYVEEAVHHITRALRLEPTVQYLDCAVLVFIAKGLPDVALHYQQQATRLEPTGENIFKLSDTYKKLGDLDNALKAALPLLGTEHETPLQIPMHLASIHLTSGNYLAGWPYWEWRRSRKDLCRRYEQGSYWEGQDLSDKLFFLYGEQGFGDIIQFSRFILKVKERYPTVTIFYESSDPLRELFRFNFPLARIIDTKTKPDFAFDYHCSLLSLASIFRITVDTVPYMSGYLRADPNKIAIWSEKLGIKNKPRIGLVWHGQDNKQTGVDSRRNIPFDLFRPLLNGTIDWYSLQLGMKGSGLIDLTNDITDFSETAAFISCLDLVVTVDTAVAHLAGALGCKTWVLSRMDGCWRWTTPWYAKAEVFQQKTWLGWEDTVSQIEMRLSNFS
jgi:hypothetical protein